MADEPSADEKAELALRLWEALAAKLIRSGVITTDVTDSIISREFGKAIEDPGITRILEAMTLRLHDREGEVPAGDQPHEP